MSGPWNDFNSAQSNANVMPKGTLAKVRLTLRPGGFDDRGVCRQRQKAAPGTARGQAAQAAAQIGEQAGVFVPAGPVSGRQSQIIMGGEPTDGAGEVVAPLCVTRLAATMACTCPGGCSLQ